MGNDGRSKRAVGAGTSLQLLHAACDLLGDEDRLSVRLQVSRLLLRRYLAGRDELPAALVLRLIDLTIEERESRSSLLDQAALRASGSQDHADSAA